jgi:hypothetical protein
MRASRYGETGLSRAGAVTKVKRGLGEHREVCIMHTSLLMPNGSAALFNKLIR